MNIYDRCGKLSLVRLWVCFSLVFVLSPPAVMATKVRYVCTITGGNGTGNFVNVEVGPLGSPGFHADLSTSVPGVYYADDDIAGAGQTGFLRRGSSDAQHPLINGSGVIIPGPVYDGCGNEIRQDVSMAIVLNGVAYYWSKNITNSTGVSENFLIQMEDASGKIIGTDAVQIAAYSSLAYTSPKFGTPLTVFVAADTEADSTVYASSDSGWAGNAYYDLGPQGGIAGFNAILSTKPISFANGSLGTNAPATDRTLQEMANALKVNQSQGLQAIFDQLNFQGSGTIAAVNASATGVANASATNTAKMNALQSAIQSYLGTNNSTAAAVGASVTNTLVGVGSQAHSDAAGIVSAITGLGSPIDDRPNIDAVGAAVDAVGVSLVAGFTNVNSRLTSLTNLFRPSDASIGTALSSATNSARSQLDASGIGDISSRHQGDLTTGIDINTDLGGGPSPFLWVMGPRGAWTIDVDPAHSAKFSNFAMAVRLLFTWAIIIGFYKWIVHRVYCGSEIMALMQGRSGAIPLVGLLTVPVVCAVMLTVPLVAYGLMDTTITLRGIVLTGSGSGMYSSPFGGVLQASAYLLNQFFPLNFAVAVMFYTLACELKMAFAILSARQILNWVDSVAS